MIPVTTRTLPEVVESGDTGLTFELLPTGVGVLTLDRPDQLNAINWPMYQALAGAITNLALRDDVKVVVLRGAGRAFCAGGDISFMRQMFSGEIDKAEVSALALRFFNAQMSLPQPIIAVVDGPAVGLGCTIALSCDMIFAGARARFADPHVQMGLVPGDGGALLWSLLVGPSKAKELLMTGDPLQAEDAFRLGLVSHVLPSDQVQGAAMDLAERLAQGPAATIQVIKALVNQTTRVLGEQQVRASLALESLSQESAYHQNAVKRFLAGDPVRF